MKNNNELGAALATIGLTEAQVKAAKAAAELAEKQVVWAERARAQQMCDATKCQGRVYSSGSCHSRSCNNAAKFHREEHVTFERESPVVTRHYCGVHDEVSKNEKRRAEQEKRIRISNAQYARQRSAQHRTELLEKLAGDMITTEQLERLLALDPDVLNTAVNDMLRETAVVEAMMEVK